MQEDTRCETLGTSVSIYRQEADENSGKSDTPKTFSAGKMLYFFGGGSSLGSVTCSFSFGEPDTSLPNAFSG